jgi:surface carbohydrate biosynthesis protein
MTLMKFIQKLSTIKFRFNRIEKSQIIIFAPSQSDNLLSKDLDEISFSNLNLIHKEINIFILLKCFLNFKLNKHYYYFKFISASESKIVITFIDNSLDFYLVENYFKESEVKFIAVQNGWRSISNDLQSIYSIEIEKGLCHKGFYMAFSKEIGMALFPKRKIIGIGSIKNNEIRINSTRDIDVLYISQYQPIISEKLLLKIKKSENNALSAEHKALITLISWCHSNNKQLTILFRSQTHRDQEFSFYRSFLPNQSFNIVDREGVTGNYKIIDRAKLLVTVDSTMGYEALSRGCKTIFFSIRNSFISKQNNDLAFGFPLKLPTDGPFWTADPDEVKMFNILSVINELNDVEWGNLILEYKDLFMIYSEDNCEYNQKIRDILMN